MNIPVKEKGAIEKKVSAAKDKIGGLTKDAAAKIKSGTGKVVAKLAPKAKKSLEKLNFAFFVGVPTVKFASIDKNLAFLDLIEFSNLAFVLATGDYYDKEWERTFFAGLNLVGTCRMGGPFEKVNGTIGSDLNEITLHGVLATGLFGSSLTAELPGKIKLGKYLETSGLLLRAQLVQASFPIAVSVLTGVNVKVPNQEEPLGFRTGFTYVPPTELVIGGWVEGMWKNPFGIPYLSIGEIGLQAGTDIQTAAQSYGILSLSRIGVRGRMGWGNKFVEMAMSISLASSRPDLMLFGTFEGGLYLNELVEVGAQIIDSGAKIGGKELGLAQKVKGKVPNFGLEHAELYISPIDVSLAGRYYKQGVTVDGAIDILGVTSQLRFAIDTKKMKIEGLGYMSTVKLPYFTLTGAGKDKERGTEDDGPIVYFHASTSPPFVSFFIDGRAELDKRILGGAYGDTRLSFSPKGIEFWFKAKLFDQFMTHLEVSAQSFLKPKDWKVIGKFEQEALDNWAKLLERGAKEIAEEATKNITKAKAELEQAKKKLADIDKKQRQIQEENDKNIQKAIGTIRENLNKLKRDKDELEQQISKCKGKVPKEAQREADSKIRTVRDREITVKEISEQAEELKRQGFNKDQIDRVIHKIWVAKIIKQVENLRRLQETTEKMSKKTSGAFGAIMDKISQVGMSPYGKYVELPKDLEGQIEYFLSDQTKKGMPRSYIGVVREIAHIEYLKKFISQPGNKTRLQKIKLLMDHLVSIREKLLNRKKFSKTEDIFDIRVNLYKELISYMAELYGLKGDGYLLKLANTSIEEYKRDLRVQMSKLRPSSHQPIKQITSSKEKEDASLVRQENN